MEAGSTSSERAEPIVSPDASPADGIKARDTSRRLRAAFLSSASPAEMRRAPRIVPLHRPVRVQVGSRCATKVRLTEGGLAIEILEPFTSDTFAERVRP